MEWPADGEEVQFPADHPVVKKYGTEIKVRSLKTCVHLCSYTHTLDTKFSALVYVLYEVAIY